MPPALREFLSELEDWCKLNQRDARRDTIRFWVLKTPAILSSGAAGPLVLAQLELIGAMLAALASVCILADGVNPGGYLRNAHLKAVHDLRALQHEVLGQWRIGNLRDHPANTLAAEILAAAQEGWRSIGDDLKAAETAFSKHGRGAT